MDTAPTPTPDHASVKTRPPTIALVGPMLGRHRGWVTSQGEVLAQLFAEHGHGVRLTSSFRRPLPRLADTLFALWRWRHEIDVVMVMVFSGPGFAIADAASRLARRLRKPLVFALHGGALPAFADRHPRWVQRVLARPRARVAPSTYLAEDFARRGLPVTVIPNAIRLEDYPYRQREQASPRLLWMRTFHPLYQPELVLHALARLRTAHPAATLTMAGQDKGTLGATRDLARELGLTEAVHFAGFLDREAKQRIFADHDIFLNTNRIDNMPVSILEAAAFGLPVVATAVGGIPHLLQDGENGLLVPDGDAAAMAAAIARLLSSPALVARLSVNGRALAARSDGPLVVEAWGRLFMEILRSRA